MNLKNLNNEISIRPLGFIPMGDKMIPATAAKRKYFIPEYSRFKAGVWWADTGKCSTFPGFDVTKNMTEEAAYHDLMKRVVRGKNPDTYTSIVLYMSIDNNIAVQGRNHNYELCCYIAGRPARTERKIIFTAQGKVDIESTIAANKQPFQNI